MCKSLVTGRWTGQPDSRTTPVRRGVLCDIENESYVKHKMCWHIYERSDKVSNRIQAIWLVRVCLARPSMPARTVAEFCRDFLATETKHSSHDHISRVRDAADGVITHFQSPKGLTFCRSGRGVSATAQLTGYLCITRARRGWLAHEVIRGYRLNGLA